MFTNLKLLIVLILSLCLAGVSFAQDQHTNIHDIHKHHIAVFVGATSNLDAEHTDFTAGIDYEFRTPFLHNKLGIGLFGEIVFAEHKETIVGLPIVYHPSESFKFLVAPGMAFAEDDHGHSHKEFIFRFGTAYELHVSGFSISPTLNADLIDGHFSLVYGFSLGFGF